MLAQLHLADAPLARLGRRPRRRRRHRPHGEVRHDLLPALRRARGPPRSPPRASPGATRWSPAPSALVIVSPNLVWNAANQFATLQHTADNADWHGPRLDFAGLAGFLAGQFAVAGPVFFAAYLAGLRGAPTTPRAATSRLMSLPILAIVSVQALISGANANWAAAAHLAALVLAAAVLAPRPRLLAARPRASTSPSPRRCRSPPSSPTAGGSARATSSSHRYVGQSALSRQAAEIARDQRPRHPGQRQPRHARRLLLHPPRRRPRALRRAGGGLPAAPLRPEAPAATRARARSSIVTRSATGPACRAPAPVAEVARWQPDAGLHHPRDLRLPRAARLLVPRRLTRTPHGPPWPSTSATPA